MQVKPTQKFFAPCPRGLEAVLAQELTDYGASFIESTDGGVHFSGDWLVGAKANLKSRIASRILWRIAAGGYRNEQDVYKLAHECEWPMLFSHELTIRVNVVAQKSPLKSLEFVTLKIKDAICDRFREERDCRPSVDTRNPDVRIQAFLDERICTLYLDLSGEPLFKRGLRQSANEAPLRENLAAGMLKLSGWVPGTPLLDPMCGSGTILLEAVQMALNIDPGLGRNFALQKLNNFNRQAWDQLIADSKAQQKPRQPLPIWGSDKFGDALKAARVNLQQAGYDDLVQLRQADFVGLSAPAPEGVIVSNPPYGVRLDEQERLAALYPQMGDTLKRNFAGWRAYFLTGDPALAKLIRLSTSKRTVLFNGALECRLFEFKVVAGSNRKEAQKPAT
ncbi:MAG: class I SAM-dependent RNA methyltransferase [Neisseriaceae bacterium]|jgi:putative N6-adenine-specific DNA methylase|nr:MAG: class I SAM-dependent RNA methyltransferase [Neisseriaceae bacterium]